MPDDARNYQCYVDGYSWRLELRALRTGWLMHSRTLDLQMAKHRQFQPSAD
ncbi:MAG: hypothetical protein JSU00_03385 [Acidobacteria bacterium]|nr:hypothetical protein [Acidobacteriota bacterium]